MTTNDIKEELERKFVEMESKKRGGEEKSGVGVDDGDELEKKSRQNGGDGEETKDAPTEKKNGNEKKCDGQKKGGGQGGGRDGQAGRFGSGFEIIGVKEKHGQLRKAVPIMPLPLAVTLCLINALLPGIGTFISSFTVFCGCKTEYESKGKAFGLNMVAAILQIITLPIIVGWIWSIVWGVAFVTSAMAKETKETKDGAPAAAPAPPPEDV